MGEREQEEEGSVCKGDRLGKRKLGLSDDVRLCMCVVEQTGTSVGVGKDEVWESKNKGIGVKMKRFV